MSLAEVSKLIQADSDAIVDVHLYAINNLSSTIAAQNVSYKFDADNLATLASGLNDYNNSTDTKLSAMTSSEYIRNLSNILFFIFYLIIIAFTFICYRKRWTKGILSLYIIALLSLPTIFIVEGYNANFFFVYADLCEGIYGAMYQSQTPIYDRGIGYLSSCFDSVSLIIIF